MKKYKLIFCQGEYTAVDYIGTLERCEELKPMFEAQMAEAGERNFYYIIKEC